MTIPHPSKTNQKLNFNHLPTLFSINTLSFMIGALLGASALSAIVDDFTSKDEVLHFPKTEIVSIRNVVANGKTITDTIRVPARVIPESLLENIQP
jgi:hypothetical protein